MNFTVDLLDDDDLLPMTSSNLMTSSFLPSCAYAKAWTEVLQFALRDSHSHLWTAAEYLVMQHVIKLPFHSLRLFGRLLLRKAAWVKSESLLNYMKVFGEVTTTNNTSHDIQTVLTTRLRNAVQELVEVGLLQTICGKSSFEEAWEVATIVLTMEDWQVFYKKFLSLKLPTKTASTTKEDTLTSIKKMITSQRTCFGTSIKDQFVKSLLKFWKDKGNGTDPPVQISPAVVLLMRRLVRFFHVSSFVILLL
jgi:hypothetical protein